MVLCLMAREEGRIHTSLQRSVLRFVGLRGGRDVAFAETSVTWFGRAKGFKEADTARRDLRDGGVG